MMGPGLNMVTVSIECPRTCPRQRSALSAQHSVLSAQPPVLSTLKAEFAPLLFSTDQL